MIYHKVNLREDEPEFMQFLRDLRARGGAHTDKHPPGFNPRLYRQQSYHDAFCTMVVTYLRKKDYRGFFKLIVRYRRRCGFEPLTNEGGNAYDIVRELREVLCRGEWRKFLPLHSVKRTLLSITFTSGGLHVEEDN
jgi:hypothetical protein